MDKILGIINGVIGYLIPALKKADSVEGIKETKEALIAMNEITVEIATKFKDGVQYTDFVSFYTDFTTNADFKAKLQAGWDNYKKIPVEIKDVDAGEALELAQVQISYLPVIVASFKK